MAEFSKQWCEINDPGGMTGDFDILEEAEKLEPNRYIDIICEGYGFCAIGKTEKGNVMLAFHNFQDGVTEWLPYNQIVK
jgi:hypothetical protein